MFIQWSLEALKLWTLLHAYKNVITGTHLLTSRSLVHVY